MKIVSQTNPKVLQAHKHEKHDENFQTIPIDTAVFYICSSNSLEQSWNVFVYAKREMKFIFIFSCGGSFMFSMSWFSIPIG